VKPSDMSTDAGSAAAPEDTATREEASDRPGLESDDPQSADSATSTPETADRGIEGSASSGTEDESTSASDDSTDDDATDDDATDDDATDDSTADSADMDTDSDDSADTDTADSAEVDADSAEAEPSNTEAGSADTADRDSNPASEGFIATMLRDATITGLPGETGAPPVEPHSPEAQQEGDEPVGSEPRAGDNPDGVD
jgi:hypothetical protein